MTARLLLDYQILLAYMICDGFKVGILNKFLIDKPGGSELPSDCSSAPPPLDALDVGLLVCNLRRLYQLARERCFYTFCAVFGS